MKKYSILIVVLVYSLSLNAQLSKGIDAMYSGMFKSAGVYLNKALSGSQPEAEACYYLGELYRLTGKNDSALLYYERGIKDPVNGVLCLAAKAGLLMGSDADQAESLMKKARSVKEYKKNPALYVALARAYAMNNKPVKAIECLDLAKEVNKSYTGIYLAEGDFLLADASKNAGEAASKYETALYFDTNCLPAYVKLANIYFQARNYSIAMQYITKGKSIDPLYPPLLKMEGDICYEKGQYSEAVKNYAEYIKSPESGISDQVRYSYALFFNKDYQKSLEVINGIIKNNHGDLVLTRLMAYNLYETGDFRKGLESMNDFFHSAKPTNIIFNDYKYHARLLEKNNQDSLAIISYQKVLETGNSPEDFYKEIALTYEKMKKYPEAASFFEKHMKAGNHIVPADLLYWGRDCYFAAGAIDSVTIAANPLKGDERKALYQKADSIFGDFANRYPEHYMGYFWRARVNAILDPETTLGLAKPYYEKVTELLEKPGNEKKKELIEAYQYLGYYYYLKEDVTNSLLFWNKIIGIDPNHTVALQAIDGMTKQNKK